MHQDVLSDMFCGEGIPDWAVDTGSKKEHLKNVALLVKVHLLPLYSCKRISISTR